MASGNPRRSATRKAFLNHWRGALRFGERSSMQARRILGLTLVLVAIGIALALHFSPTSAAPPVMKPGEVNDERIAADAATGVNWLVNGRTNDSKHFSPLKQINSSNVASLGLAWYFDYDGLMGVVSEPIVVDGVIYVSAPLSRIYAVDAATGKLRWKYDPQIRLDQALNGSYSARTNGGVAVWNGKVYVGTGDCRLIAIDAATANKIWEATVCEPTQTGITGAPRVAKGKILMGYNGSDDAVRGALAAYDAETGREVWRFWTVPGDSSKPYETKELEMAAKTWHGEGAWKIGGGDVWHAITYDDGTGLVIFGTAGADVGYGELAGTQITGEKLFSQCIIAVDADTGKYVWHFQTGTEGVHNENNQILMADLPINGERRHVVMTAPKNGFFYILDAKTGKLLSAKPLVKTTWASAYDLQTQKPILIPASQGGGRQWTVHNWWPMSYDTLNGLVYIPTTDRRSDTKAPSEAGESGEGLYGRLIAWDPVAESARWSVEEEIAVNGGVLSTAGNLVFQGQGTGEFAAYAADTGKKLWSIQTKSAIDSIPVTFSVKGEQYVITSVGWGSGSRLFAPARTMATPESKRGPIRLYAFKLGGNFPFPYPHIEVPAVPKPPELKANLDTIRKGEKLYVSFYCEGCHSPGIDGSGAWVEDGAVPDLRYAPPEVHKDWYQIVMGGSHWSKGMPGLADPPKFTFPNAHMAVADADAIHAYVISQAWKAYKGEQTAAHAKRENY
ncbi:MAG: PQQ-dependent dehydrogenase, methanol/ethanol family [Acidobacteria bacterium]|nr:MAG: PQQ-dependent dehydrogenase, methanol/ethanol family [Acidobacteriota bacterium]